MIYEHDNPPRGQVLACDEEGEGGLMHKLADLEIAQASVEFGGQHGALREVLRFIDDGTTPQCECHDNVKSFAMVLAAIESSRKGERVAVEV